MKQVPVIRQLNLMKFNLTKRSVPSQTDIWYRQIPNWHRQLLKYNTIISILMQDKHIFIWA